MKISEIQKKINKLKTDTDSCILAHSYMSREIIEIADHSGDSYKISVDGKDCSQANIIVCGVRFMAETAKILSPGKRVFLPNPIAGCPMAEQFSADDIRRLKENHPDRAVVAYINTTAEIKKLCDVCVTSSSAVKIVKDMDAEKILFIPDCNLGDYVKKSVPEKDIMLVEGGCPVHAEVTLADVESAKAAHPNALVLVHPECPPDVVGAADFVGSTSAIMDYAKSSGDTEFIIGTEMSIREHLQYDCQPEGALKKDFYPLSKKLSCPDMRMTSLSGVLLTLEAIQAGTAGGREITMNNSDIKAAGKCINEMVK